MSLFLKIAAATIGLIVLLVGGAAIYLTTLFDANDYKTEIQTLVKQQTQLDLKIDGELKLSVFPWLGVSVENAAIDTSNSHLASIGFARIFAKFTPLLKGEVEVDGIALRDIKLNLIKDAKGQGNWELKTSSSQNTKPVTSSTDNTSVSDFSLGYLEIENADISYRDLSNNSFHQLQNMELRVNNVRSNSEFPISAGFQYLNSELSRPIDARVTSQISLNIDKQLLSINDTVLDIGTTRIRTDLEIQKLLTAPFLDGKLNITEFKLADWSGILQLPALDDTSFDLDLKADFQFDTGKGKAAMQNLSISGPELALQGAMNINGLNDNLSYLGKLNVNQLNPSTLLKNLNIDKPQTSSPSVLNHLTGNLDFKGTVSSAQLNNINLTLDNSTLKGSAALSSLQNLSSQFSLSIDQLNIDQYLPEEQPDNATNQADSASSTNAEEALLPLDTLRDLKTQGRLRIGKLIADGHQVDDFDAQLTAANGFINLKSLTGKLYGGQLKSSASIDARGKTPQFNFNKRLTGIQASPLLSTLADVDYVDGILDLQINGTAFGNSLYRIKNTITGEADFKVSDGLLKNTNIEQLVCKGIARIRDRNYAVNEEQPGTEFKEFNGHMNIVKGVMQSDRLLIALNNIKVNGTGLINLPKETLDYSIRATIQGNLENQACEVHERYRDVAWPIRCQGSFSDEPSELCGVDQRELQSIAAQLAKKEVQRKVNDKLGEKLKDKLGDEAAEQLRGLLGF